MARVLTLGEIMMRLSTPVGNRLNEAQSLAVHYGGGEANVAISLANFGHETYFASKVPSNAIGKAVCQHLQKYRVHTDCLLFGGQRLGTYYMESGNGPRGAAVTYDRKHSSFAEMRELEWETKELFDGVDLFHISGITPALSTEWQTLTLALMKQAKLVGCMVSFDCNYRGNLWSQAEAGAVFKRLLSYVDYCSAGPLDAQYLFGIAEAAETNDELGYYYQKMHELFPNVQYFYSTKRTVLSASHHQLQGTLWWPEGYVQSTCYEINPIVDRVGAGDAFSAGLLNGLLKGKTASETIEFATAAAVLKHTIHGDCNQFTDLEVNQFLQSASSGKIIR